MILTKSWSLIAGQIGVWLLPFYLLVILAVMTLSHEKLQRVSRSGKNPA